MGFLSFLFGETAPATAFGEPVAPETLPADGNYPNAMPILRSYIMNPKPTEGGIKLARLYKNRCAVTGIVQKGSFQKGDYVIATVDGKPVKVLAHDVIEFEFEYSLHTTVHDINSLKPEELEHSYAPITNTAWSKPKPFGEGKSVWIILELTALPDAGTAIVKL